MPYILYVYYISMNYNILRFVADKPSTYAGEKLRATGSVQYTRDERKDAKAILDRLFEMTSNQSAMSITKHTRFSFRCEDARHKYMFKVVTCNGHFGDDVQDIYL